MKLAGGVAAGEVGGEVAAGLCCGDRARVRGGAGEAYTVVGTSRVSGERSMMIKMNICERALPEARLEQAAEGGLCGWHARRRWRKQHKCLDALDE